MASTGTPSGPLLVGWKLPGSAHPVGQARSLEQRQIFHLSLSHRLPPDRSLGTRANIPCLPSLSREAVLGGDSQVEESLRARSVLGCKNNPASRALPLPGSFPAPPLCQTPPPHQAPYSLCPSLTLPLLHPISQSPLKMMDLVGGAQHQPWSPQPQRIDPIVIGTQKRFNI